MVVTKIDFLKVITATAAVFMLGLALGFVIDTQRTDFLSDELRKANLNTEAFIVGQLYLEQVSDQDFCHLMDQRVHRMARDTTELGNDLQNYGEAGMFREQDYKYLQHQYYLYQVRFLLTMTEYNDRCDRNTTTVMFFFGDNVQSRRQGATLTSVRKQHQGEVFVFSFNKEAPNTPVVDMIESDYNITQTPTLVINKEEVLRGYVGEERLNEVIADHLQG